MDTKLVEHNIKLFDNHIKLVEQGHQAGRT